MSNLPIVKGLLVTKAWLFPIGLFLFFDSICKGVLPVDPLGASFTSFGISFTETNILMHGQFQLYLYTINSSEMI